MPIPTSERIKKAGNACSEAVKILRKHPEFDEHRPEDMLTEKHQDHTIVTADVRFTKSGQEIFRNPAEIEDYDWPALVGGKILEKAAREAAKKARLKLTQNVRVYIMPSEKGWVEVGYQFLHEA